MPNWIKYINEFYYHVFKRPDAPEWLMCCGAIAHLFLYLAIVGLAGALGGAGFAVVAMIGVPLVGCSFVTIVSFLNARGGFK